MLVVPPVLFRLRYVKMPVRKNGDDRTWSFVIENTEETGMKICEPMGWNFYHPLSWCH